MSAIDLLASVPGTMISGTLLGFVSRYMNQSHERQLAEIKARNEDLQNARMVSSTSMQVLRFVVILIACLAFFGKPFIAAAMHWPMWVSYTESHGLFMALWKGASSTVLKSYYGLVNSPTDNEVILFIMTFLFGTMRVSRMR
jgi:hypothetical protein